MFRYFLSSEILKNSQGRTFKKAFVWNRKVLKELFQIVPQGWRQLHNVSEKGLERGLQYLTPSPPHSVRNTALIMLLDDLKKWM